MNAPPARSGCVWFWLWRVVMCDPEVVAGARQKACVWEEQGKMPAVDELVLGAALQDGVHDISLFRGAHTVVCWQATHMLGRVGERGRFLHEKCAAVCVLVVHSGRLCSEDH